MLRRLPAASALCALTLGMLAALAPLAVAEAPAVDEHVVEGETILDEAWYFRLREPASVSPEDPGDDPTGGWIGVAEAEARGMTNPFPRNTLHVGVVAGQPLARTYLGLSQFAFVDGQPAEILGGTLRLVDNEEHSVNAETADMVACSVDDLIVPDQAGVWDSQPPFDCDIRSEVTLVEGSDPLTWEIDLAPFAEAFAEGSSPGIAVVEAAAVEDPDPTFMVPPDPEATWHVSFDTSARTADELEAEAGEFVAEVEAAMTLLTDPGTVPSLIADPEPTVLLTFLVLQLPPDPNALYADMNSRQLDEDRELRPATVDMRLAAAADDFNDFDDTVDDLAFDDPTAGADDSAAPFDAGTSDPEPFEASAPSQESGPSFSVPGEADDAPEPAVSAVEGAPEADHAEEAATRPTDEPSDEAALAAPADVTTHPAVLLLPLLGLGLAATLGYSLTREPTLEPPDRSGALSRLPTRS